MLNRPKQNKNCINFFFNYINVSGNLLKTRNWYPCKNNARVMSETTKTKTITKLQT